MDEDMNPLYILGWPLGYVMEWIYKLLPNYGWDIILFTLLINIVRSLCSSASRRAWPKCRPSSP